MKKTIVYRSMVMAFLVLMGCVFTNAKVIISFGSKYQQPWEASYFYAQQGADGPATDWYVTDFDDSQWGTLQGPISDTNSGYPYFNAIWTNERGRYWVRHHFNIDEINTDHAYYLLFSHDDECQVYINGVLITNQGGAASNQVAQLSAEAIAALQPGDNVLAMYVNDSGGGGHYLDFGLYEDDGSIEDIVQTTDVQLSFTNDAENPWWQNGLKEAYNGNRSKTYSTSWLQMTFSSTQRTELKFDWYCNYYSDYHAPLQLFIDGVKVSEVQNGSWTTPRFYIDPGDHVIAFRDSISHSTYCGDCGIRNICLQQVKSLEATVLTVNSQPLTFTNTSDTPWIVGDECVEHTNYGVANTGAVFSTSFTIDKTSKLSFDRRVSVDNNDTYYNREESHHFYLYVNGLEYQKDLNLPNFTHFVVTLEPGSYTVEWNDTVLNWYANRHYYTQIKNIELSNQWVNVDLATAGTLGYEVLYSPGVNVLTDVEFLKIKGPMNTADWTDIKNMTNLLALDLSEAEFTDLPNQVFDGKSLLSSVILPEGLKTIGEYAFRGTDIRRINIPSTVTTIGRYAFASTPINFLTFADNSQMKTIDSYAFQSCQKLQSIDFGNNSQLEVIGFYAFQNCTQLKTVNFGNMTNLKNIKYAAFADCTQLTEFIMPNSVTEMGCYLFNNNTSMTRVHFSDGLKYVGDMACRCCTALTEVHLPVNAETINRNAFESTTALRHIDIPETVTTIQFQAFYNCGLDSIVLPNRLNILGYQCFYSSQYLRYAEMPSFISSDSYQYISSYNYWGEESHRYSSSNSGWDNTFQNCPVIEKIVMRSATPPTVVNDIMNGGHAKSEITLVVPSFAVVSYKLDTYWYQYGTIIEGDDVDYWKITSPLMLTNNRRMQGTPDVDLYYGGQFTVGGNAPMPMGKFNIFVNESNPGRLVNSCEAMTADEVTTKFSADANKWYFFTPLYDVAIADIEVSNNASYVFRYYDAQNRAVNGASGSWKNVDTDKLIGGQGYIFHCNTACVITFPADAAGQAQLFKTTDVTRALDVNEAATTANRSWNYVGNPYPCYYDIYYMDFTAPITVWNGSSYQAYSIADDDFVLRPMQSFFVQKPDAVDEIIFHKEGRQQTTAIAHGAAARMAQRGNRHLFDLAILNDEQRDVTRVVINNEASLDYEIERDAAKFISFEANTPQIYTTDGNGNCYAINERPMESGMVQLAYYAGQEGLYTIHAQRADGEVYLYDMEKDRTVDLTKGDYSFQSGATKGFNDSRFTLTFKTGNATGIENIGKKTDNSIYDLQGRRVTTPQKGIFIQNGKKVVRQ